MNSRNGRGKDFFFKVWKGGRCKFGKYSFGKYRNIPFWGNLTIDSSSGHRSAGKMKIFIDLKGLLRIY